NEPDRHWIVDKATFNYDYKILKGIHPTIGGMYAHFNPGLFFRLLFKKYKYAVVGGMGCPSYWVASFCIFGKKKILSVESNMDSVKVTKSIGFFFKRLLISQYDTYQVTGKRSIEYLKYFQPKLEENYITLPNIIEEEKYRDEVRIRRKTREEIRKKHGITNEQLWICPSRLEKIKGLHLLFPLLSGMNNIKLLVAGTGSMESELHEMIESANLPVKLLGFVHQDEMLDLYAASDLFILPSLSDPSPLSPIEAIAAGLPIAVSHRIGNHDDVFNSKNGFSFDIMDDKDRLISFFRSIGNMMKTDLAALGKESSTIYNNNFDTVKLLRNYANQIKFL
ncbi:MAG: glycosyltransferase family 4 protein, partial [Leptospiraceae bacterium]|nr:glycosyltransferase family 4 protein [Leptospiraceae bacterium]